jgi:hypothetical protein
LKSVGALIGELTVIALGRNLNKNGEEIKNNSGEEKVLSMGIRQVRTVSWSLNWGQAVFFSNVFVYLFLQSP